MNVKIPDFGALLAPFISVIPEASQSAFLARLERTAANRYREWAVQLPAHAAGLMECALREDDIADRIEAILPAVSAADQLLIDREIVAAKNTYYQVFEPYTVWEQLYVQANAERQGAAAWRAIAQQPAVASLVAELETCSAIEETSADFLDRLLAEKRAQSGL